jgi:Fibronectin type III domain
VQPYGANRTKAFGSTLGGYRVFPKGLRGRRSQHGQQGVIAAGLAIALAAVTLVGLAGAGAQGSVAHLQEGGAWLRNLGAGTVTWVNGFAGRPAATVKVAAPGRNFTVVQRPDGAYVVDRASGKTTRIDGATLTASASDRPGFGRAVTVLTGARATWVVDRPQGVLQEVDPRTLAPKGARLAAGGPVTAAEVDSGGRLWVAVPSRGAAVEAFAGQVHPVPVGAAGAALTIAKDDTDERVVAVDATAGRAVPLTGDTVELRFPALVGPGGSPQAALDRRGRLLITAGSGGLVAGPGARPHPVDLPDDAQISQAAILGGTGYLLDRVNESVLPIDLGTGRAKPALRVPSKRLPDLVVRGGLLFINDPAGADALVVDGAGAVRPVEKYRESEAGKPAVGTDDGRRESPRPGRSDGAGERGDGDGGSSGRGSGSGHSPERARPTAPGAPRLTAVDPGDASATARWTEAADHRAPVSEYVLVVDGDERARVGAGERSTVLDDLTNGQEYRVQVRAVNAVGPGPLSDPVTVTPSADLPSEPTDVAAEARDEALRITWGPARADRTPVTGYEVLLTPDGGDVIERPAGAGETGLTVGDLENGQAYRVQVRAVTRGGKGPMAGPADPVTPFGKPGAVTVTGNDAGDGTATVTWALPDGRTGGSPVLGYRVSVDDGAATDTTATSYRATGLTNDQEHSLHIRARNAAGEGPEVVAKVLPVPTRKSIFQCQSKQVVDIWMLNLDNDCNNPKATRWKPGSMIFRAVQNQEPGSQGVYRCARTYDRAIVRRSVVGGCPSGWSSDGLQFYAWKTSHAGATQIAEYQMQAPCCGAGPGGYYYAPSGQGAPSGFAATGTKFWT